MRFAIIESGGKQYRAVEGTTIDVDRLVQDVGKKFNFERVLLMADGDTVMVGTPTVNGIQVSASVLDHIKGPKVISFKYRPKKRIRVKSGHRHQFTRLMIEFIGKPGEERKVEKPAVKKTPKVEAAEAPKKTGKKAAPRRESASKSESKPKSDKAPARKSSTAKKPVKK